MPPVAPNLTNWQLPMLMSGHATPGRDFPQHTANFKYYVSRSELTEHEELHPVKIAGDGFGIGTDVSIEGRRESLFSDAAEVDLACG
jgi:hypothetical protein